MILLLVAALACVHLAVRGALGRVGEPRKSVAAAATLAVLAALPELLGRPFESLGGGLALCALLAAPVAWRLRSRDDEAAAHRPPRHGRAVWLAAGGLWVLGAWTAFSTFLWDEGSTHFGLSAALARGVLPPEHPLFPGEPFAYHYGYDVLVALLLRALPLPQALACDLVTLTCLAVLMAVLADAGRTLAGPRGAWLAVLVVPLGYGPAAALLADGWGASLPGIGAMPAGWVSAPRLPPPLISSFFQHPQGLGMPIALATLLLASGATGAAAASASPSRVRAPAARFAMAAALLALLAVAQSVFFVLTGLALGVMVLVDAHAARSLRALWPLVALALAALAGALLGPLLRGVGGSELVWRGYFADGPAALLLRHALLFGATALAIPVAALRLREPQRALRVALMVAAAAGFVVANTLSYARSWDGVKFFAVGAFFANLLLADQLAVWGQGSARRRALGVAVLLLSVWSSAFWLLRHGPLNGVVAARYTELPPDPVAVALARQHGHDIGARERVLTAHTGLHQAGFLVEGADWRRGGEGYRLDRAARDAARAHATRALQTLSAADLSATAATWLLIRGEVPTDAPLTRVGEVAGLKLYRIERGR
ncbi:MAG: hypothetical protein IT382_03850 [Deltaproteobacteria bacterium]|nr:hypothetical protein [Deltaproteobacteria bacterium]